MYEIYLDGIMLPVAPAAISTKVGNRNKSLSLVDGTEITLIKQPHLTEISFSFLLPCRKYPFAVYENGFRPPVFYLEKLKKLKENLKPFKLIIIRNRLHSTTMKVTLENFSIMEDKAKHDSDIIVNISLKEYQTVGIQKVKVKPAVYTSKIRDNNREKPKYYTVKPADTIWDIAQITMGDTAKYIELYRANNNVMSYLNSKKGKSVYSLHEGQKLKIPH